MRPLPRFAVGLVFAVLGSCMLLVLVRTLDTAEPLPSQHSDSQTSPSPLRPEVVHQELGVDPGPSEHELARTREPAPRDSLAVHVVGPESQAIPNAVIRLLRATAEGTVSVPLICDFLEDADHYEVRVAQDDPAAFGAPWPTGMRYWIEATAEGLGTETAELMPTQSDVTIRLGDTCCLTIVVDDFDPSTCRGDLVATVSFGNDPAGGGGRPTPLGEDGRATFSGLHLGRYRCEISALGGKRRPSARPCLLTAREIVLYPGTQECHVTIDNSLSLTVVVPTGNVGESVDMPVGANPWIWSQSRQIGSDLSATFENLRPGRYVIQHSGSVPGFMTIDLNSSTTVPFHPAPFHEFEVVILDPTGLLGKAGFRDGDRIVRINGVEFSDALSFASAMSRSDESVRYSVRGDDGTVREVRLTISDLSDVSAWGGLKRPSTQ